MDDDFIPDEPVRIGTQRYNQELRELLADKWNAHYDREIEPDEIVVMENKNKISAWVDD